MKSISSEKILITGGTGSLGQRLTRDLCESNQVVVFSRNEERQFLMKQQLSNQNVSFLVGDVADSRAIDRAMWGVTMVIHAAAMKDLDICEVQPSETVRNNIIGSQVVAQAALLNSSVKKVLAVSTDKAATPSSVYGSSKYIMEKIFEEASKAGKKDFLSVRFGNMIDSSGSLLTYWRDNPQVHDSILISHRDVSRFFFSVKNASETVIAALSDGRNGETWIRKMKKISILDALQVITGRDDFEVKGLNPGEKVHESLVSDEETRHCFLESDFYVLRPGHLNANPPSELNSESAEAFSKEEIRDLLGLGARKA